ncbi:hypothetical protein J1N35_039880 [Gossypium stocksii]|uniref:Uncharacterized protein n=1 Tax=Gossypium stocksii TaxID=47602 RepID=A0A9D3UCY4_9ROSI|nr:hypothetical protein J1N35_039880 [Gossypium stocksii]
MMSRIFTRKNIQNCDQLLPAAHRNDETATLLTAPLICAGINEILMATTYSNNQQLLSSAKIIIQSITRVSRMKELPQVIKPFYFFRCLWTFTYFLADLSPPLVPNE